MPNRCRGGMAKHFMESVPLWWWGWQCLGAECVPEVKVGKGKVKERQWRKCRWGRWAQNTVRDVEEKNEWEEESGQSTGAVATGNLIYMMSSWPLFSTQVPGWQRIQKEHCPLLPSFPLILLSFFKSVNTHLSLWFRRCPTFNRRWKGKQLNQPKEEHRRHSPGGGRVPPPIPEASSGSEVSERSANLMIEVL